MEYYMMLISWGERLQPFATAESGAYYDDYIQGKWRFVRSYEALSTRFPELRCGTEQVDFPHFWFYSALAAVFYQPLKLAGADIGNSFNLVHLALLGLGLWVSFRRWGHPGAISFLLVCLVSPTLWYVDKAHTEFFTIALGSVAMVLFATRGYASAGICLAAISTQNPPFAILAVIAAVFGFAVEGKAFLRQWPYLLIAASLVALHPCYYLLRHGAVSPQFLLGVELFGESGGSFRRMTCFLVDPDLGLFPNWPFYLIILAIVSVLAIRRRLAVDWPILLFSAFWVCVSAWAHSKTVTIASGGSTHVARYALWYLPLLLPPLVVTCRAVSGASFSLRLGAAALVAWSAIYALTYYWPFQPVMHRQRTEIARLLYRYVPEAYDPLPRIFLSRTRPKQHQILEEWAVANPSGRKVLINARQLELVDPANLPGVSGCSLLDPLAVYGEARRKLATIADSPDWFYLNRPDAYLPEGWSFEDLTTVRFEKGLPTAWITRKPTSVLHWAERDGSYTLSFVAGPGPAIPNSRRRCLEVLLPGGERQRIHCVGWQRYTIPFKAVRGFNRITIRCKDKPQRHPRELRMEASRGTWLAGLRKIKLVRNEPREFSALSTRSSIAASLETFMLVCDKRLAIVIDGDLTQAARVYEPISDGVGFFAFKVPEEEVRRIARTILRLL
jgi:hypothetical protein